MTIRASVRVLSVKDYYLGVQPMADRHKIPLTISKHNVTGPSRECKEKELGICFETRKHILSLKDKTPSLLEWSWGWKFLYLLFLVLTFNSFYYFIYLINSALSCFMLYTETLFFPPLITVILLRISELSSMQQKQRKMYA